MRWVHAIQNRFQYYSDKLKPQFRYRWMATFVLACFYAIRAYLHGHVVITYFLGMIVAFLVFALLTSSIDKDDPERLSLPDASDYPPILLHIMAFDPSDELRPFRPILPEFIFWRAVNFVLCVALGITFIPLPSPPEQYWYIWFVGWLLFTLLASSKQIEAMTKYKYLPFYYGDKKRGEYKGK